MGRRAADPTTPVPVLGVPALFGARGWKAVGENSSGGAVLQTLGLHCNIGVQTSPWIGRPLNQSLETSLAIIPPTSNGLATKDVEKISTLTKSYNEKDNLGSKTGEAKIKKGVTFRPLMGVACSQRDTVGPYCYARAIKSNPVHPAATTRHGSALKAAARYINGSVVDSEAIGGISEVNDDTEPVQEGLRDRSAKTVLIRTTQSLSLPLKVCNRCGRKQSVTSGPVTLGENCPTSIRCPAENPLKPTLPAIAADTTGQRRAPEQNPSLDLKCSGISSSSKMVKETDIPKTVDHNQQLEPKFPHPACPVHSGGNLASLVLVPGQFVSHTLDAKSTTVPKVMIENREDDFRGGSLVRSSDNQKLCSKQSLSLSTSAHRDVPPSFTYAKKQKTIQLHSSPEEEAQKSWIADKINKKDNLQNTSMSKRTKFTKSPQSSQKSPTSSSDNHNTSLEDSLIPSGKTNWTAQSCAAQRVSFLPEPKLQVYAKMSHVKSKPGQFPASLAVIPQSTSTFYTSTPCKTSSVDLKCTVQQSASTSSDLTGKLNVSQLRGKSKLIDSAAVLDTSRANHTRGTGGGSRGDNEPGVRGVIPDQDSSSTVFQLANAQNERENHNNRSGDASRLNTTTTMTTPKSFPHENKLGCHLNQESAVHQSKEQEKPSHPHVTDSENYISLIKTSAFCLRGGRNAQQQRLAYGGRHTDANHKGHGATSPAVETAQQMEANAPRFARGGSDAHANAELKPDADTHTHPNYLPPAALSPLSGEFIVSHTKVKNTSLGNEPAPACQASDVDGAHKSPPSSDGAPAPQDKKEKPCVQRDPKANDKLVPNWDDHCGQLRAVSRANLNSHPSRPDLCPRESRFAHAHPAHADLLLSASPKCYKSASLQQKLKDVEASLANNKERIAILLNIIQELEMCHTPSSSWRCCKSGQDLKTCSTCQRAACIMYSVEYDFRQQERRLMGVFSSLDNDGDSSSSHPPPNFGQFRSTIVKNLAKSKWKGKKICKALLKLLPRKV